MFFCLGTQRKIYLNKGNGNYSVRPKDLADATFEDTAASF
jgi:hypothetical protein